jgi:hypothetical protein
MTWNLTDPTRTLDRALIVPGLAVWDYNMHATTVAREDNDGWWFMADGCYMSHDRMWVRHPVTDEPAGTRVTATTTERTAS